MRVRLINPFVVELAQLDTVATKANTSAGGYDDDFNEVRVKNVANTRVSARTEKAMVRVRSQIEDDTMNALMEFDAGDSPKAKIGIVFDYYDLRKQGLLDPTTKEPLLHVADRLNAIYDIKGALVLQIRTPPGLYCVEARPISYGIGRRLNLLLMRFDDREVSARA